MSATRKIVKSDQLSKSPKSQHSVKKSSSPVKISKSKSVEPADINLKVAKKSKPIEAEKEKTDALSARLSLLPVVKPKKPLTAFLSFMNEEYAKMTKGGEPIRLAQKTQEISEKWRLITDDKKMKFMNIAKADRERYDHEMAQLKTQGFFITSDGMKSTDIPRKLKQFDKYSVVLPKQRRSALCYFVKLNEHKFRKQNEKSNLAFVIQAWAELSDQEKKPYTDMSLKDKIRRQHECEQLTTLGYFVNENGAKSTEMKVRLTREVIRQRREQADQIKMEEKEKRIKMKEKLMKIKTEETTKQLRLRERKQMQKLNEKKRLEREKTKELKLKDLEKEKKLKAEEKEKSLKLVLKEKKVKSKEKEQALKIKNKAIHDKQSQRDEQLGWQRFYRKNFANEFENDDTPNKIQRKINVDEKLRSRWLSLSKLTRNKHIQKAREVLDARHKKSQELRMKGEAKKSSSKSTLLVKRNKPSTLAA